MFGRGDHVGEQGIAFAGGFEDELAGASELVIFAGRALFGVGDGLGLPVGADEFVALEAAHGGIDGAGGKAGHLHDAETVDVAGVHGLEDHGGGVGEAGVGCHEETIPM